MSAALSNIMMNLCAFISNKVIFRRTQMACLNTLSSFKEVLKYKLKTHFQVKTTKYCSEVINSLLSYSGVIVLNIFRKQHNLGCFMGFLSLMKRMP